MTQTLINFEVHSFKELKDKLNEVIEEGFVISSFTTNKAQDKFGADIIEVIIIGVSQEALLEEQKAQDDEIAEIIHSTFGEWF